jgi:hypothetical protein
MKQGVVWLGPQFDGHGTVIAEFAEPKPGTSSLSVMLYNRNCVPLEAWKVPWRQVQVQCTCNSYRMCPDAGVLPSAFLTLSVRRGMDAEGSIHAQFAFESLIGVTFGTT